MLDKMPLLTLFLLTLLRIFWKNPLAAAKTHE